VTAAEAATTAAAQAATASITQRASVTDSTSHTATATPRTADATPRSASEGQGTAATGPLRGLVGRRLHPRAPPRKGTSAFLSVSRAQLDKRNRALLPQPAVGAAMAASEAPAGVDGSAVLVLDPDCHYWEGYDHLTRPSSRGPIAE
jgi:hypothetical protein